VIDAYLLGANRLQSPRQPTSPNTVAPVTVQADDLRRPAAGTVGCGDADAPFSHIELMDAVRKGDRGAFQDLYELFAADLLALCERVLHNRADAEDVVAEVFWELWRRRDRYDADRGGARPYLMTLARSRAIDRLRSQASRPEMKGPSPQQGVEASELAALQPLPERAALDAELRSVIAQALARLDPCQREAMELAYYEGLSHQQIAARLDSPLGTIKTHIRKGLAKLRHALRNQQTDERT
jgi:RNA polymerase sigma-70 factor, ECF subfamily